MTHSAEKELGELERAVIPMLWDKIKKLAEEPRPRQSKRLKGMEKAYRLRFRDYRVIYNVDDDQKLVTVLAVRHRKEAYR